MSKQVQELTEIDKISKFLSSAWDGQAWHGPPFKPLLEGIDAKQALAHPLPGRHNIWELVNHVAFWIEKVTESLEVEGMPDPEGLYDWPPAGEVEEDWVHDLPKKTEERLKTHPRGRKDMPLLGIFATRTPYRPNPIGLTLVELLKVNGCTLTVLDLDAFDGTPILDIKPYDKWDVPENSRMPEWWWRLEQERRDHCERD